MEANVRVLDKGDIDLLVSVVMLGIKSSLEDDCAFPLMSQECCAGG